MAAEKLHPDDFRSLADLQKFPFTTKEDLRSSYPLGFLSVPQREIVRIHASSGSSGLATLSAYTKADLESWTQAMIQCLRGYGLQSEDRVVITHGYGLFTGGLGVHYGAEKMDCMVIPTSSGNTKRQIELIRDLEASVVVGNPSYLLKLGLEMQNMQIDFQSLSLRFCICGAEPWSESLRSQLQKIFGIPAYDLYGLSEVTGPGIAAEVAGEQGLLVIQENYFFPEIEDGELILTSLQKEAMPLLRYKTGDCTGWGPKVINGHRTIRRISGRKDHMIKIKGVAVYPSQIEDILLRDEGLNGNYLIEVSRPHHLDVVTVKAEERYPGSVNPQALLKALQEELNFSVELHLMESGELPESGGKAPRFIDRRS